MLATTKETISLPNDLCGVLKGRSSIGRMGILIHTAGFIDAGFSGELTLELYNFTEEPITIPVGQRVCQLVLMELDTEPTTGYGEHPDSKYQGQSGATPSELEDIEQ